MKSNTFIDLIEQEFIGETTAEDQRLYLERVKANKCHGERGCEFQYDYPYMLRTRNGDLHILYTWNKSAIRHGWLKANSIERNVPQQKLTQGSL